MAQQQSTARIVEGEMLPEIKMKNKTENKNIETEYQFTLKHKSIVFDNRA